MNVPRKYDMMQSGLLVLILFLGWTLRTHALENRSLWADEGWTMLLSKGPGLDTITRTMAADQHPPLFFVMFRLWRNVAGDTEFATRYASVLIGIVALAGIYQLGRSLFDSRVGLLAAFLLALADLHIDLSQEVRHYSLLATLTILSSWFYVRWSRQATRANRIGYVLISAGLLYTHYLGAYVLIAHLLHMLLFVRPRARLTEALFLFGAICLAFLPWLPVVIDQNSVRWDTPLYYQNALPNTLQTYRAVRDALLGKNFALLALPMALGVLGIRFTGRAVHWRSPWRAWWPTGLLVTWIAFMTILTVIINERREFLTVRNFIVIVPPLLVLVARGLATLDRTTQGFMVVLIAVVGLTTVDARRHYPDWRAVTRNVSENHLDAEPVVMDVWVGDFPVRYYVDHQLGCDNPRVSLREWRDRYQVLFLPTLLDFFQRNDAFWLIAWGDASLDEYGSLITETGFQRTAAYSVDHLGTPIYTFRYDKLSEARLAVFDDLFSLHKFQVSAPAAPGEDLIVSLWWTAEQPPPLDYSVSVFLLDAAGTLVAQHDGPPTQGMVPTSQWQPGMLQFDQHHVHLPDALAPGHYELGLKVYWYGDNVPLPARTTGQSSAEYVSLDDVVIAPR